MPKFEMSTPEPSELFDISVGSPFNHPDDDPGAVRIPVTVSLAQPWLLTDDKIINQVKGALKHAVMAVVASGVPGIREGTVRQVSWVFDVRLSFGPTP